MLIYIQRLDSADCGIGSFFCDNRKKASAVHTEASMREGDAALGDHITFMKKKL